MSKTIVAKNFPYNPILTCMQTGAMVVINVGEEE